MTKHQEALEAAAHLCPICAEPFRADDLCATDIGLGICHAACLEGSPTVELETGEPVDGPIPTYRYEDDAATLAPADNRLVLRYSMSTQDPFDRDPPGLEPDNDGDWVTYSDYKVLLSDRTAQAAEIDRLKALLGDFLSAHQEGPGLLDCIDNGGERYTSQFLADTIERSRSTLTAIQEARHG